MRYEQHCDHLRLAIAANIGELRGNVQAMRSAPDYALAVAGFVQSIMLQGSEAKLWSNRFGLTYCALVVPSQMFAIPVRALFSAEYPSTLDHAENILGPECGVPISFFERHVLYGDLFGLQFMPDYAGDALGNKLKRTHNREIVVRNTLIDYIAESWRRSYDTERVEFDVEDVRCKAFLAENRTVLGRIFGDCKYVESAVNWYLFAISELIDVRDFSRSVPPFIYFIPGTDRWSSHPGACCFMFSRQLPAFARILLRLTATQILEVLRLLDHDEFQRRSIGPYQELSIKQNELHAIRTALGTLRNKLHAIRLKTDKSIGEPISGDIRDALRSHSETLEYLTNIEGTITSSASYQGPLINLRFLQHALRWKCRERDVGRVAFHIAPLFEPMEFDLLNPWEGLIESVNQFIEGGLADSDISAAEEQQTPTETDHKDVNVFMYLFEEESQLLIAVKCKQHLPEEVVDALRSVTLFDRLPSKKEIGGKGILNAIATIRSQYRGKCSCITQDDEASWGVLVPVKIVYQYELFRSASRTIEQFLNTYILKEYSLTFADLLREIRREMETMDADAVSDASISSS